MKTKYLFILILLAIIVCLLDFYIENQYLLFTIITLFIAFIAFFIFIILTLLYDKNNLKIKFIKHVTLIIAMAFIGGLLLSNRIIFPFILHLNQQQINKLILKIYEFNITNHRYPDDLIEIKSENYNIPMDFTNILPRPIYYHKYNNNFIITYGNYHNMVSIYNSKIKNWVRQDDFEYNMP